MVHHKSTMSQSLMLGGCLLALALFGAVPEAHAQFWRLPVSNCVSSTAVFLLAGETFPSGTGTAAVLCPVVEDETHQKRLTEILIVSGFNADGGRIAVQVCSQKFDHVEGSPLNNLCTDVKRSPVQAGSFRITFDHDELAGDPYPTGVWSRPPQPLLNPDTYGYVRIEYPIDAQGQPLAVVTGILMSFD
jgi:hypothetical protein